MKEFFLFFHSSVPMGAKERILKNVESTGFKELPRGKDTVLASFIVVMSQKVNAVPAKFFAVDKRICIQWPGESHEVPDGAHVFDINSLTCIAGEQPSEALSIFLTRHVAKSA